MPLVKRYWLLGAILLLAVVLRGFGLTRHDVIDDEALMAFRSYGWLDTWFGSMRSPVDLFTSEQWWQALSFHDHPPLHFWVEHFSFQRLGPTVLALRLPFVAAGMLVVILAYVVGRQLYDHRYGLVAATLTAVLNYPVWASRVGFQEGILLVWLFACLAMFVRSFKDARWCLGVGLAFGLGALTKYSVVVMLPVLLGGYLLLYPRVVRQVWWYAGAVVAVLVMAPVIVYNAMLYRTRGHFDATLWTMLGRRHEDFASDYHPFSAFGDWFNWWHWMPDGFGWLALVVTGAGLVWLLSDLVRCWRTNRPLRMFGWVALSAVASTAVFLSLSPGRKQYVALASLPVVLGAAYGLRWMLDAKPFGGTAVTVAVLLLAAQTANSQWRPQPWGIPGVAHLTLRPTSYAYRELDRYFDEIFANQPPVYQDALSPQVTVHIQRRYAAAYGDWYSRERSPLVIFDERFDFAAVRWTMLLPSIYRYRTILITSNLVEILQREGGDYFERKRFNDFRFVFFSLSRVARDGDGSIFAERMRKRLMDAGYVPERTLPDASGRDAFVVYRTNTLDFLYAARDTAGAAASVVEEPAP